MRLNEHLEHPDDEAIFRHACKLGLGGDCVEAARLALSFRPFARLAQAQEPGGPGGEAGGRGGLWQAAISDLIATHWESHNRRQLSIPPPTPFGGVGSMLG